MHSSLPNMTRTMAVSPATLEGWLSLSGALGKGRLGAALGEQIALATVPAQLADLRQRTERGRDQHS